MATTRTWDDAVYRELHAMADSLMSAERGSHTLQATALVHETWMRLLASRNAGELDRGAFVGLAAQAMRRILTEHARRRATEKRGGGLRRTTLAGKAPEVEPARFALELDAALRELAGLDPELASVVELRFYGGFGVEETADALGLSPRTVKRRYRFARAWLQSRMEEELA